MRFRHFSGKQCKKGCHTQATPVHFMIEISVVTQYLIFVHFFVANPIKIILGYYISYDCAVFVPLKG